MANGEPLFISWIRYHGRSAGLAEALGIDCVFVDGGKAHVLRRYLRQWRATRKLLRSHEPSAVVVMQPPIVALLCIAVHTARTRVRVYGDLHTGVFSDPKWRWATNWTLWLLRRRGGAIVTNEHLASACRDRGVTATILHDVVQEPSTPAPDSSADSDLVRRVIDGTGFVLAPLTYAFDEPVSGILEAAARVPELTWVLTGTAPMNIRSGAPSNVVFPGYVANDDYLRLLSRSRLVIGLTTQENTMQRAGYEALSAGKPFITTPRRVLRGYFGDAVIYSNESGDEIAAAVEEALRQETRLAHAMAELRTSRIEEQSASLRSFASELREAGR